MTYLVCVVGPCYDIPWKWGTRPVLGAFQSVQQEDCQYVHFSLFKKKTASTCISVCSTRRLPVRAFQSVQQEECQCVHFSLFNKKTASTCISVCSTRRLPVRAFQSVQQEDCQYVHFSLFNKKTARLPVRAFQSVQQDCQTVSMSTSVRSRVYSTFLSWNSTDYISTLPLFSHRKFFLHFPIRCQPREQCPRRSTTG
jgi:hypothetical protein